MDRSSDEKALLALYRGTYFYGVADTDIAAQYALLLAPYGMLYPTVAASFGFLTWNWLPAKIFMGDAGSGFLGFLFRVLVLGSFAEAEFPLWAWLILLGVFLVDASVTLVRRILRGERFYEAHRSHAYQHAARRYGAHLPVTLAVGAINLLWLLPLAYVAVLHPVWGVALSFRAGLPE